MIFSSYTFLLVFLPITVAGFAVAVKAGQRAAVAWLVACSLAFYGWWNPVYLVLLGASIGFNYGVGLYLLSAAPGRTRAAALSAAIALNLIVLGYFKYAGFAVEVANLLTGAEWRVAELALPLAISFFTFLQIAYLVDAYRGSAKGSGLLDYAFFVTFFPHLIAGPIVHHREILPQLAARRLALRARDVAVGLSIFEIGLAKKVLLADELAPYATQVFDAAAAGTVPGFATAWLASVTFLLQLYFDFSAYSDMAIGLSRIFGIALPLNFDSPLKAASMIEFWARWHMTMTRFFRQYLWTPLRGARPSAVRRAAALLTTFLLIGLWHGAAWTFVLFGLFNGLCMIVNQSWRAVRERVGWRSTPLSRTAARALTFATVTLTAMLFRAGTLECAGRMLAALFGLEGFDLAVAGMKPARWLLVLGALLIVWAMPNTQQILYRYEPALGAASTDAPPPVAWRPSALWAGALALLTVASLLEMSRVEPFVYYRF